ncbi:cytochrome P450 [Anderseniella sp. Alg231-50]|uniref:cytochrome P450 n=1 Tax=Anderseniella sp. Alg231-50 TaxID=1922226 RepID=UPI000D55D921
MVIRHSLIHRSADREEIFRQLEPVCWSDELDCWLVTGPDQIRTAQKSKDLVVINHQAEVQQVSQRLKLNLDDISDVLGSMPLSTEGTDHSTRRKRITEKIKAAKPATLAHFADLADKTFKQCIAGKRNVELVSSLFYPLASDIVLNISGVNPRGRPDYLSVTQIFDRALGLKRRLLINDELQHMRSQVSQSSSTDDASDALALAILGSDSLLGSFSLSFMERVRSNPDALLCDMDWSRQLTATSVPFIERQAVNDLDLAGTHISAGQRVRLYLDRFSYETIGNRAGFFGLGRHACPGRSVSQGAWQILGNMFAQYRLRVTVNDMEFRRADSMFSFPTRLEVNFHEG